VYGIYRCKHSVFCATPSSTYTFDLLIMEPSLRATFLLHRTPSTATIPSMDPWICTHVDQGSSGPSSACEQGAVPLFLVRVGLRTRPLSVSTSPQRRLAPKARNPPTHPRVPSRVRVVWTSNQLEKVGMQNSRSALANFASSKSVCLDLRTSLA
jgi:hypothetical protein